MTTEEFIADWKAGKSVWVIRAGAGETIGPCYHLDIHLAAIYAIMQNFGRLSDHRGAVMSAIRGSLSEVEARFGMGLSGYQGGIATAIAFGILTEGYGVWMTTPHADGTPTEHVQIGKRGWLKWEDPA